MRGDAGETRYVHRFSLPAAEAARCFARNAEAHSSALVSEVSAAGDRYDVTVRVKNGTPYAIAHIVAGGTGAAGKIDLNVRASQGNRELLDALVDGC